jgi:hypothetical protein
VEGFDVVIINWINITKSFRFFQNFLFLNINWWGWFK